MNEYHTALHADERATERPKVWLWEDEYGNKAFVHDVTVGLPVAMADCDILYAELPWKDGYHEFLSRAGAAVGIALPYEKWLYRLSVSLARFGKPFVIVAGHAASRHLAYEWSRPVDLNGSMALAMGAGHEPLPPGRHLTATDALLNALCQARCIGDFCAGFGRTAHEAYRMGRKWICSDLNPRCIGTIVEWAEKR